MQGICFVSLDAASDDASLEVTRVLRIEAEHSPPPPMAFAYGPGQELIDREYAASTAVWPVSVYVATGVEVVGPWFVTGVLPLIGDVCLISDELYQNTNAGSTDAVEKIVRVRAMTLAGNPPARRVPGTCVLIATQGHLIFGHWLIDFLPKLYLLREAGFDVDRLSFLVPMNMDPSSFTAPNLLSLLRIAGLRDDQLIPYDPNLETMCPDELIIPTLLRMNSRMSSRFGDSIAYLNDRIRVANPDLGAGSLSRIFISRSQAGRVGRQIVNWQEVERQAAEAGFAIVHPEQMAIPEQISLFRGAREIMGQYGSALHGSIYSSPGTKICGLQGTGEAASGFAQSGIGERLDQPTGYVFGLEEKRHPDFRFFHVNPADLAACLASEFA
jgi:capsular polysaccharide biosynthesis protein